MPKPLTPEQLSALQDKGVVIPGYGSPEPETDASTHTMPAGLIQRTLGSTGLPHTVSVERMGEEPNASTSTDVSFESLGAPDFEASYRSSCNTVQRMMILVGETVPDLNDPDLISKLERLKPTFELFAGRGLQPEVVLYPAYRELAFWQNLTEIVQDSPLNPDEPDPDNAGATRKVLRNGGLWITPDFANGWKSINNPGDQAPAWKLAVVSSKYKPTLLNTTGYGYTDNKNQNPHPDLNRLLQELGKPAVPIRSDVDPLNQPPIHPTPEGYIMHQLTRIIQQKTPLDVACYSWLDRTPNIGVVLVGDFSPPTGAVYLSWRNAGRVSANVGIRPSVRAEEL